MNYNKVLFAGRLVADPVVRNLPSGSNVVSFSVATSEKYKDKSSGDFKEETTFLDCDAFGKLAENIERFFKKGRQILVEGKLRQDTWQDKDGNKRSKVKLLVTDFRFVDAPNKEDLDTTETEDDSQTVVKVKPKAYAKAEKTPF